MAEWTTVWVIVKRSKRGGRGSLSQPWVWDADRFEWVHKGKALLNALYQGARFQTKEKAEEAALMLAMKCPEYMGTLYVEAYKI